eukprot:6188503-Pleurochrysis_carterae.AAC.3
MHCRLLEMRAHVNPCARHTRTRVKSHLREHGCVVRALDRAERQSVVREQLIARLFEAGVGLRWQSGDGTFKAGRA